MNNIMQAPYLREQRQFPYEDIKELANQSDLAYIDVAANVNVRTIGIFPVNTPAITGESWYTSGQPKKQQTLRQLYLITGPGSYPHGIKLQNITGLTKIYGTFTNSADKTVANWYPLPYVDTVAIANQVSISVTPTNIVITRGATAPAIVSGFVVLEWLSNF